MKSETSNGVVPRFDVAFVGAGLSSAATLLELLEQLLAAPPTETQQILVAEKDDQFYTGIAYGQRSSNTSLIITPLNEFLPPAERAPFATWMATNLESLMADVESEGGSLTDEWVARTTDAIAAEDCDAHHVPRFFFGRYMSERVSDATDRATTAGVASVHQELVEIASLDAVSDGYNLVGVDGSAIGHSMSVVLGLGMPPTRSIFGELELFAGLIDDPYQPSMAATRDRFQTVLAEKAPGDDVNVLLIGANASGLEMLYQLTNAREFEPFNTTFTVLSPQGRLPDRYTELEAPRYQSIHLANLSEKAAVTASEILGAVQDDITQAKQDGLSLSDYLPAISGGVGALLGLMDADEKLNFVNYAGVEIGRIQRRAGHEYSDTAQRLLDERRLEIISGYFADVTSSNDGGFVVRVQAPDDGLAVDLERRFDLIMNCTGSGGLERPNQSALLENLLASGLCAPTIGGNGLALDDHMAAAPDLYVIGPLMAGNVVGSTPIWHVEHAGRILSFSSVLAEHLHREMTERPAVLVPQTGE